MNLTFQDHAAHTIATISGRLDSTTSTQAQEALLEKINQSNGSLILDLSGLAYLSSAGLRALLAAVKKTSAANRRTAVVVQQPQIREILQISGFNSLVPDYETLEAALETLSC